MRTTIMKYLKNLDEKHIPQLVIGVVVVTSLASLLVSVISVGINGGDLLNWLESWLLDFSTDLAVGGILYVLVRMLLKKEQRQETYFIDATEIEIPEKIPAEVQIQEVLVELKRAPTPETRQPILERISQNGMILEAVNLVGMDLQRANFSQVNLQNANLTKTVLRGANLRGANLRGANLAMAQLIEADLQGADLSHASLEKTYISGANLQQAQLIGARVLCSLWGVDLQGADMQGADLRGAELFRTNLRGANLQGVHLAEAKINRDTILPDGQHWHPQVDITRFTNPDHPQFWRSDDVTSPAYE